MFYHSVNTRLRLLFLLNNHVRCEYICFKPIFPQLVHRIISSAVISHDNLSELQMHMTWCMNNAIKNSVICVHRVCLSVSLISGTSLCHSIGFFQNIWQSDRHSGSLNLFTLRLSKLVLFEWTVNWIYVLNY